MEANVKGPAVIHADDPPAVSRESEIRPQQAMSGLPVCFCESYVHFPRSRGPGTLGRVSGKGCVREEGGGSLALTLSSCESPRRRRGTAVLFRHQMAIDEQGQTLIRRPHSPLVPITSCPEGTKEWGDTVSWRKGGPSKSATAGLGARPSLL